MGKIQAPIHKKDGIRNKLYYPKTKSHVRYVVNRDHILISCIRSHRTGDAHNLMAELYRQYPNKLFRLDVIIAPARKRALQFWKSEGFKIVNKVKHPGMQFYEMERENG